MTRDKTSGHASVSSCVVSFVVFTLYFLVYTRKYDMLGSKLRIAVGGIDKLSEEVYCHE